MSQKNGDISFRSIPSKRSCAILACSLFYLIAFCMHMCAISNWVWFTDMFKASSFARREESRQVMEPDLVDFRPYKIYQKWQTDALIESNHIWKTKYSSIGRYQWKALKQRFSLLCLMLVDAVETCHIWQIYFYQCSNMPYLVDLVTCHIWQIYFYQC